MRRKVGPKATYIIVAAAVLVAAFIFWKTAVGKKQFVPRGGEERTPTQSWEVTRDRGEMPERGRGIYRQQQSQEGPSEPGR